jgi:hypothetical protein
MASKAGELLEYSIDAFVTPDPAQFSSKDGWTELGKDRFMAFCYRFILVRYRSDAPLDGPLIDSITIPANSDYTLSKEEVTTETFTDQIQSTIEDTFAIKTSEELSKKLSAKVSASVSPSAEIATEVLARMAAEIADSVKKSLTATRSYSLSVSKKSSGSLVVKAGNGQVPTMRTLSIYAKVWEWKWDFYLYDIQHLSLKYARRNRILWSDVQRTIEKSGYENAIRLPLFTLTFYEPTGSTSVAEGDYTPAIANAQQRRVSELSKPLPDAGTPQEMKSLETYAKLAFPTTPEEEKAAKRVLSKRLPPRTPSLSLGGEQHATNQELGHSALLKRSVKGKLASGKSPLMAPIKNKTAPKKAVRVTSGMAKRPSVAAKTIPAVPNAKKTSKLRKAGPK